MKLKLDLRSEVCLALNLWGIGQNFHFIISNASMWSVGRGGGGGIKSGTKEALLFTRLTDV